MAQRSERLDSDLGFANLDDIEESGPSELGQRRLTDLGVRVIEAARGSWFAWLVCAVLVALGIIGTTWLVVTKIWPIEDDLARAQAELAAARQENDRLLQEMEGLRASKVAADEARAAAFAEAERQRADAEHRALDAERAAPEPTKSKKLPRLKKRGKKR
jgi:hypothetical protein